MVDESCTQGPIVDDLQFKRVLGYIEAGKAEGARLAAGGARHGDKVSCLHGKCRIARADSDTQGYFIQPTVFADVTDDMKICKEEIFGPVMSIIKFSSEEEVIERANKTIYGLAGSVCTNNIGRVCRLWSLLHAANPIRLSVCQTLSAPAPSGSTATVCCVPKVHSQLIASGRRLQRLCSVWRIQDVRHWP